ncbi:MAG: Cys-tRNA(Pro) deacylase [Clostridia bacterium]|nr:Cys-tRNA(Pro) deacylase [Clostridia bacterium]
MEKTNAMRILDKCKAVYIPHTYESEGAISGQEVAVALGRNPDQIFKTLVTIGKSRQNYVFVIPSTGELNLKSAAACAQEKSIEMIKSKELLPLTGYIHGGCSPIGMKKLFNTYIDSSAQKQETIIISAGKIGLQIEISTLELNKALDFSFYSLI